MFAAMSSSRHVFMSAPSARSDGAPSSLPFPPPGGPDRTDRCVPAARPSGLMSASGSGLPIARAWPRSPRSLGLMSSPSATDGSPGGGSPLAIRCSGSLGSCRCALRLSLVCRARRRMGARLAGRCWGSRRKEPWPLNGPHQVHLHALAALDGDDGVADLGPAGAVARSRPCACAEHLPINGGLVPGDGRHPLVEALDSVRIRRRVPPNGAPM